MVNIRIGKNASDARYQMDEKFQNTLAFRILIVFQILKILISDF